MIQLHHWIPKDHKVLKPADNERALVLLSCFFDVGGTLTEFVEIARWNSSKGCWEDENTLPLDVEYWRPLEDLF